MRQHKEVGSQSPLLGSPFNLFYARIRKMMTRNTRTEKGKRSQNQELNPQPTKKRFHQGDLEEVSSDLIDQPTGLLAHRSSNPDHLEQESCHQGGLQTNKNLSKCGWQDTNGSGGHETMDLVFPFRERKQQERQQAYRSPNPPFLPKRYETQMLRSRKYIYEAPPSIQFPPYAHLFHGCNCPFFLLLLSPASTLLRPRNLIKQQINLPLHAQHIRSLALFDLLITNPPPP